MSSTSEISEDEKTKIRKYFNVDKIKLFKLIEELKNWAKNENLPEDSQDEWYLELMLLHAKFDVEKTKKRILTYFTKIGKYQKLFQDLGGPISLKKEQGLILYSPTLTPQLDRVISIRMQPENVINNQLDCNRIIQVVLTCALIDFHTDYCAGFRFILDFNDVKLVHLKHFKLVQLLQFRGILEDIIKVRISGIELLNAPNLLHYIMPLARAIVSAKIFGKFKIHKNFESLRKEVPVENLAKIYGGLLEEEPLIKRRENLIREQQPLIEKIKKLAKRQCLKDSEEVIPKFQLLNID